VGLGVFVGIGGGSNIFREFKLRLASTFKSLADTQHGSL
jgi:hypothetical protein